VDCLGFEEERSSASEPFCMKGAILLVLIQSKLDVVEDNEKVQAAHPAYMPHAPDNHRIASGFLVCLPLRETSGVTGWKL
jgi:hypothetical protein